MERLAHKIESFLRTGSGDFESLALELFSYQFEKNRPYQAYCHTQGIAPSSVHKWQDIPAVPIGAFKSAELATFPTGQAAAIFESSATTTGTPSRHYIKDLRYYETSLKTTFAKHVPVVTPAEAGVQKKTGLDSGFRRNDVLFFILTPPPAEAPRSSLSWMMDVVKRTWGGPGSDYFIQRGRLDEPRLARSLRKAEESRQPVILLGTTIAFLSFFDHLTKSGEKYKLASGSRLMDTGGMKSQKREVKRPEFVRSVGQWLGIAEEYCINEYGMCELGSQFYGKGTSSYLEGPPWTRTLVIDGHLRHFDLANVDSVMAVQTEDVGRIEGKGFFLEGRNPNAEIKGCSIAAEAFVP